MGKNGIKESGQLTGTEIEDLALPPHFIIPANELRIGTAALKTAHLRGVTSVSFRTEYKE